MLRSKIQNYLLGASSLDDLQLSLVDVLWDNRSDDADEIDLGYTAELLIAEFTGGHRTETELKKALREALASGTQIISIVFGSDQAPQQVTEGAPRSTLFEQTAAFA